MADNVAITAGSGTTIATDDVGGVHYQRVKLAWGVDGTAADVATASPAPVSLATDGTVLATAVSVGTSATLLPASALSGRKRVLVQNQGSVTVYLGGSGVTTAAGVALLPQATLELPLGPSAALYGRVASGTSDVRVLEFA